MHRVILQPKQQPRVEPGLLVKSVLQGLKPPFFDLAFPAVETAGYKVLLVASDGGFRFGVG